MITQRRGQLTQLFNKDPEIKLWYCRFAHISNIQIIKVSKLVYEIKLSNAAISNSNDDQFSSNSKTDDKKGNKPDIDMHITPAPLSKIMEGIKDFFDIYIENKHTKIIKYKAITLIVKKLEKIYAKLWSLHDPSSISEKSYIGLLLDKYT